MAETDEMRHARENLEAQQRKLAEAAQELQRQKAFVEEQQARAEQLNSELASAEAFWSQSYLLQVRAFLATTKSGNRSRLPVHVRYQEPQTQFLSPMTQMF